MRGAPNTRTRGRGSRGPRGRGRGRRGRARGACERGRRGRGRSSRVCGAYERGRRGRSSRARKRGRVKTNVPYKRESGNIQIANTPLILKESIVEETITTQLKEIMITPKSSVVPPNEVNKINAESAEENKTEAKSTAKDKESAELPEKTQATEVNQVEVESTGDDQAHADSTEETQMQAELTEVEIRSTEENQIQEKLIEKDNIQAETMEGNGDLVESTDDKLDNLHSWILSGLHCNVSDISGVRDEIMLLQENFENDVVRVNENMGEDMRQLSERVKEYILSQIVYLALPDGEFRKWVDMLHFIDLNPNGREVETFLLSLVPVLAMKLQLQIGDLF